MAITLPAHVVVANILHATVPLLAAGILFAVGTFAFNTKRTKTGTMMAAFNKGIFYLLAFYGLVTAFTGALLLTNYDSVASLFGIGLEELEAEFEAIHGAVDITTPTVVTGATIRDIQAVGTGMLMIVAGIINSWYYVNGEYMSRFLTAMLFMFQGVGGYLIWRAATVEQIVFWSIVGAVGLIAYLVVSVISTLLKLHWRSFPVLFPAGYFALHCIGLWVIAIMTSPVANNTITYEATSWIVPGVHTVYLVIMALIVYLTQWVRQPIDGVSFPAIFNAKSERAPSARD